MTTLDAIKARVNYPLTTAQAEEKLISRGVGTGETFTKDVAESKGFRLAYADTLRLVLTMVNLSQGGSVTAQNMAGIRGTANAIYKEYGEILIGETGEALSTITDRSDMW
jgi:hypothetical protein